MLCVNAVCESAGDRRPAGDGDMQEMDHLDSRNRACSAIAGQNPLTTRIYSPQGGHGCLSKGIR